MHSPKRQPKQSGSDVRGERNSEERPTAMRYVTKVGDDDVLLGRGATVNKAEGNVRFRSLILANRSEYRSTGKHAVKDVISRRVLETVGERGGRFLRKVESDDEKLLLGISSTKKIPQDCWVIADEAVSLQKIKQALRDNDSNSASQPTASRASSVVHTATGRQKEPIHSLNDMSSKEASSLAIVNNHKESSTAVTSDKGPKTETIEASSLQKDLDYRLRHPMLRKRDLKRLRQASAEHAKRPAATGRNPSDGPKGSDKVKEQLR